MKTIFRYLKYYLLIMKLSYMKSTMYRVDHLLRILRIFIEFGSTVLLINALFIKTQSLGGWTKPEVFLIYSIWLLILCLHYFLTSGSVFETSNDIRRGNLDWLLIKPIDSQFASSFRQVHIDNILRIVGAIIVLIYSLSSLNIVITIPNIILFLFQLMGGIVAFYSFMFLSVIMTFVTQGSEQISIFDSLISVGKYPIDVFPKYLIPIFWSVLPIAYFSILPAKTLLGRIDAIAYLSSVFVPFVLLFAIRHLWNLSLRHYSSASS